ncbi:DUF1214 domain-containing protein [Bradyrhizobium sp. JYMT SZCCT0428]|uniref:DUF1214 domain-containing protein n=1 Tax=Bradyrhizobium sp. JYMT SZCCT0428 TaxID=2807673 RepID=UPI001BA6CE8F|nr:DUF1214 domain-containing protein [Bradyrhizobium sp. JYMT SZCCT0428]MBR1149502.1 DUF1214 domain-containing protein [Bradyrhizobium sp. JYMT SZCCT0428]
MTGYDIFAWIVLIILALQYGKDGSLTIYVSNASPGKDKESNWLPAPAAKCSLVARVYGPSKAAMTGQWKLPPLEPEK